ncbi:MAG: cellulase family glycosylhydrolase [Pirellulales bacterium]|nr:cellulase family glycosylhydrolase [Pirellulales bacterium]
MYASCVVAIAFAAGLASVLPAVAQDAVDQGPSVLERFVTRQGDKLMDGPVELRFVSFNIPNLHYVEDNMAFTETSPWRLPDEFEIADALKSIHQMGGGVARLYTLSVRQAAAGDDVPVHVLAPGEFNEDAFRALDRVLQQANRLGVRVIIPLVDNWVWWGGRAEYAAFRGKPKDAFWTDPQLIADFRRTIDYVANRRNAFTGVRYKDDKAILAWETGNELECPQAWTRQIAGYLKRVDPNHLVIDGRHAPRLFKESIDEPNTDVVTTHHYALDGRATLAEVTANRAMCRGKKPYFVGEFGFIETPAMEAILDRVIENGTCGALIWSLRCHNRDGGFYWHSEPLGHGKYKAYHWPGFAEGAAHDEPAVLDLMRRKAFAIRGLAAPPLAPPEAPRLLPIDDVAAIAWQGSAGATAYNVERAASRDGPWTVVGENVSDAAVQYRPLFADVAAAPPGPYYYRVIATNSAGSSPPSEAFGPVKVAHRSIVDELCDGALLHSKQGSPSFVSADARKAKEDVHRLAMRPGDAVDYKTDGPLVGATVWAFYPRDVRDVRLLVSSDGERFAVVTPERDAYYGGAGEYGYYKPVRYRLAKLPPDARYLRIEPASRVELARVELRHGPVEK